MTAPRDAGAPPKARCLRPTQLRVILFCALALMLNGYATVSISLAVPMLAAVWDLPGLAFANTFVASSIGIVAGGLALGPASDRLGRKPVLIASLALLAIASLACARVTSVPGLMLWRCLTGIGIGGIIPATAALTADHLPDRMRAPIVMLIFTCDPLGGFLGGQLIERLLPGFGWPVIFWLSFPPLLALIPAMLFWLPESPCLPLGLPLGLGLARGRVTTRTEGPDEAEVHRTDAGDGNPITELFRDGMALANLLVWILWLANYLGLSLISYWLPAVLTQSGQTPMVSPHASNLISAATIAGAFALTPFCWRFGPRPVLAVMLPAGAFVIALVCLVHLKHDPLLLAILLMRFCIIGGMTASNGMTAALYDSRVRATGIGWALAIGRLGIIGGPWVGGALLSAGWPPTRILLCASGTALIGTVCVVMLHVVARRRAPQPLPRLP